MANRSVNLNLAAQYDCDECGREVFLRLANNEAAMAEHGDKYTTIVRIPTEVTCPHCGTRFEAFDGAFGEEVPGTQS